MAYIGQRPVIGRYIKLDQISSGFNGSNTGFSMTAGSQAVFPGTARNLLLSLGGVIQEPDTDFTISGSTLTFTTPPVANTTFFGVIYGDMQATGTPSDGTVLPASIASSGHFKIPQLTVNEDGADVDFRVEGDTDANLLFVDASADKVGIGTASPDRKFVVTEATGNRITNFTTGGSSGAFVAFLDSNTTDDSKCRIGSKGGNDLSLRGDSHSFQDGAGGDKMHIDSSGIVGIGTTTPEGKGLDVTVSRTNAYSGTTDTRNLANVICRNSSGAAGRFAALSFINGGGTQAEGSINLVQTADYNGDLTFKMRTAVSTWGEVMRITSAGNVGIGTASPNNLLNIHGVFETNAFEDTNGNNGRYTPKGLLIGDAFSAGKSGTADDRNSIIWNERGLDIDFATNDTVRMTLDHEGKLGIGTNNPSDNLEIASGVPTLRLTDTDGGPSYHQIKGPGNGDLRISCDVGNTSSSASEIQFDIHDSNKMVIQSLGNVGIGTSTITDDVDHCKLVISGQSGTAAGILIFQDTSINEDGMMFADDGSLVLAADRSNATPGSTMQFRVDGSNERMRINSDGRLLIKCEDFSNDPSSSNRGVMIGDTSSGSVFSSGSATGTQTHLIFRNGNGDVGLVQTSGSSTSYNTSSDYRLKENAVAISDGITRLKTLKPYRFNFKADSSTTVDGFFAHEVTAVPEAITGTKDETEDVLYTEADTIPSGKKIGDVKETIPKYQGIDQSKLVPLLVAAVQELIGKVEALEAA